MDVAHDVCRIFGADPGDRVRHVRDRAFNDRRRAINRYRLAPAFSISMHALGTPA
jgi:dTDP-D-glucose 4,6-dehydratase